MDKNSELAKEIIALIDSRFPAKLQTTYGVVTAFDYEYNVATVQIAGGQAVKVINRSGELLKAGDMVEIEYALSENRIAKRFGEPAPFGHIIVLTQEEYDNIDEKKENVLYAIRL